MCLLRISLPKTIPVKKDTSGNTRVCILYKCSVISGEADNEHLPKTYEKVYRHQGVYQNTQE